MPKLVFIDPRFAGRSYEFAREKTTVGRADDNLLVIRDASISSHHCEILVNGGEVIVRDLNSRNGTFVNGERLRDQQRQVRDGARVRFGTVEATVEIEPQDEQDDATAITAVISYKQAMNQGARPAASTDPALRLDPGGDGEGPQKTILMPQGMPPESRSAPTSAPAPVAPAAAPAGRGRVLWWLAAVIVAAVLVWLFWLRK